jgi:hypothetical protein
MMAEAITRPEPMMPDAERHGGVACPLCHTSNSMSREPVARDAGWRCTRCGQRWDSGRLAAVAAYAVWSREYDKLHTATTPILKRRQNND